MPGRLPLVSNMAAPTVTHFANTKMPHFMPYLAIDPMDKGKEMDTVPGGVCSCLGSWLSICFWKETFHLAPQLKSDGSKTKPDLRVNANVNCLKPISLMRNS